MGTFLNILRVVPLVVTAVKSVERLFKKDPTLPPEASNAARQDAAIEMVGDLIPILEAGLSRDVIDDVEAKAATRTLITAIVTWANILKGVTARLKGSSTSPGGGTP